MKLPKIVLASGSPRRSEILNSVGWEFQKKVADVDETPIAGEMPEQYVERLAIEKARKVAASSPGEFVLGADTTVVIDGEIIGKPVDLDEAAEMIRNLSGRWHEVLTGVAFLRVPGESGSEFAQSGIQSTDVKFRVMSDEEIDFLVKKGDPLDKAGAYAVQAQAALFIEEIRGDFWNIVGLPINLVYSIAREGIIEPEGFDTARF